VEEVDGGGQEAAQEATQGEFPEECKTHGIIIDPDQSFDWDALSFKEHHEINTLLKKQSQLRLIQCQWQEVRRIPVGEICRHSHQRDGASGNNVPGVLAVLSTR
jgi:hypothetical protein